MQRGSRASSRTVVAAMMADSVTARPMDGSIGVNIEKGGIQGRD